MMLGIMGNISNRGFLLRLLCEPSHLGIIVGVCGNSGIDGVSPFCLASDDTMWHDDGG